MNSKGDIPITILVMGVVGLCILTIFSFMNSNGNINDSFVGPGLIETIYSIQEEIAFGSEGNLIPFEKEAVKVDFEEDKIIAEYFLKDWHGRNIKSLIKIKYEPTE